MQYFQYIKTIIKTPSIFIPQNRILLLSHMRANTSLFGHLLGSNPEIDGYYELHVNYGNKKNLLQQKLKYFQEHEKKSSSSYFFDKVLHNHHVVNPKLFSEGDSKIILMIREPSSTIESIIKLYNNKNELNDLATLRGASEYYLQRLAKLKEYSVEFSGRYFFLEAEHLITDTDHTLKSLSSWLDLKQPLRKEYHILKKTGVKGAGDSSEKMTSGVIITEKNTPPSRLHVDENVFSAYKETLEKLITNSCNG
jgi:hypothetical protein